MSEQVRVAVDEMGIARLVLDNPPLNALGPVLRRQLGQALARACADPAVRAILLMAAGPTFPAGAELTEAAVAPNTPDLTTLCARIEACPKPVIAVLQGTALGAGCELALAAHYRLAAAQAHIGLPEVTLGLPPSAGATQRLPRLAGPAVALEMMLVGKSVTAAEAARLGLVDRVAEGDLDTAARTYAAELLAGGAGPRPTCDRRDGLRDAAGYQAAVRDYRARVADRPIAAPGRIVDCVAAAQLLPFEAGLAYEAAAFEECADSDAARALRYAYMAERRLGVLPAPTDASARRIETVAVIGVGPVAAGWAIACLDAGVRVLPGDAAAQADLAPRIGATYSEAILHKRLSEAQRAERLARLADTGADLAQADLVIATGAVDAPALEAAMQPGAVLALSVPPGGAPDLSGLARPADALIVQVTAPAHLTRLTEVLPLPETGPGALIGLRRLLRRMGRVAVVSPAQGGGIGASVWGACARAALGLVAAGSPPETVAQALRAQGFTRAPWRTPPPAPPDLRMRALPPDGIVTRCLAAMANTGALLLEAGLARQPSDIDLVMIHGYGFPRWRGGPMMAADQAGLLHVQKTLQALREDDSELWAPSRLFADLIKNGRHFADLNTG
ncbi:enoyl-CoA hydratase-related protein [Actibacterium sp. D379-3]